MVRMLFGALVALTLVAQSAAAPTPAELAGRAVSQLRDARTLRYDVVLHAGDDLRSSPLVVRSTVLAELDPDRGLVGVRSDSRVAGRDIPRGQRWLMTIQDGELQFLNYGERTETTVPAQERLERPELVAGSLPLLWIDTLFPSDANTVFFDDPQSELSVTGPLREGRDEVHILSGHADGVPVEMAFATQTGLPVRFTATLEGLGPINFQIQKLRTGVPTPDSSFDPIPVPRGFRATGGPPAGTAARPAKPAGNAKTGLATGQIAPDFTLQDPDGTPHSLSDYRGKVVLIDFWGVWCHWCKVAMPEIQQLHREYADDGLVVLAVNCRDKSRDIPIGYMRAHGYDVTLLLEGESVASLYNVSGFPTFVLLDQRGAVVFRASGYGEEIKQKLGELIRELLDAPPPDDAEDD